MGAAATMNANKTANSLTPYFLAPLASLNTAIIAKTANTAN